MNETAEETASSLNPPDFPDAAGCQNILSFVSILLHPYNRQPHLEHTVFYRVFFHYFELFLREYESRFEKEYGYFRPVVQDVVEKILHR